MVVFCLALGIIAGCVWALLVTLYDALTEANMALDAAEIERLVAGRRPKRRGHSIPLCGDEW